TRRSCPGALPQVLADTPPAGLAAAGSAARTTAARTYQQGSAPPADPPQESSAPQEAAHHPTPVPQHTRPQPGQPPPQPRALRAESADSPRNSHQSWCRSTVLNDASICSSVKPYCLAASPNCSPNSLILST